MATVNLRQTGTGWEFDNEAELENFICDRLASLLDLTFLQSQYKASSQICDILAVDRDRCLTIVELKNSEDRYIIQQLTRYYDALLEEQPFSDHVDYSKSVRLMAIAPSFHRDNFTDIKYHKLNFELLEFSILQERENFFFNLKNLVGQTSKVRINVQKQDTGYNIPNPPKTLTNAIEQYSPEQQKAIADIRTKILTSDPRMQEFSSSGSIKYGNGNKKSSKFCGEFYLNSKGLMILFLWLPLKNLQGKTVGRTRMWTNWLDKALIEGYVATGIGRNINSDKKVAENLIKKVADDRKYHNTDPFKLYNECCKLRNKIASMIRNKKSLIHEEIEFLYFADRMVFNRFETTDYSQVDALYKPIDYFVDLALEKWRERI